MSSSNIRVMVRPRPLDEAKKERWAQGLEIHGRRLTMGTRTFDPDVCLTPSADQEEVFSHCIPILEAVKEGNNGTILVYGQTGTGKTHTMIGGPPHPQPAAAAQDRLSAPDESLDPDADFQSLMPESIALPTAVDCSDASRSLAVVTDPLEATRPVDGADVQLSAPDGQGIAMKAIEYLLNHVKAVTVDGATQPKNPAVATAAAPGTPDEDVPPRAGTSKCPSAMPSPRRPTAAGSTPIAARSTRKADSRGCATPRNPGSVSAAAGDPAEPPMLALALSIVEIYNEKITDMLSPGGTQEVQLLGGHPRSLLTKPLASMEEARATVSHALNTRQVTATAMNDRSSRSHVILILDLHEVLGGKASTTRLCLVDLAGSESIKKSQATGKAAMEAGMINKSLLALKNVIMQLSTSGTNAGGMDGAGVSASLKPGMHVSYRDSRLTELLQDSVGGTARTMFIACISPNGRDVEETKSTLEYATRARSIRNLGTSERDRLRHKVAGLEIEVQRLRNRVSERVGERNGVWVTRDDYEQTAVAMERLEQLESDVVVLRGDAQATQARQGVASGQTAVLRAALREKEFALERTRSEFATAIANFRRRGDAVEAAAAEQAATLAAAARGQTVEALEKVRAAAARLEGSTAPACGGEAGAESFIDAPVEQMRDAWAAADARHCAAVKRLLSLGAELGAALGAAHAVHRRGVSSAFQRIAAAVAAEATEEQRLAVAATADMLAARRLHAAVGMRAAGLRLSDDDAARLLRVPASTAACDGVTPMTTEEVNAVQLSIPDLPTVADPLRATAALRDMASRAADVMRHTATQALEHFDESDAATIAADDAAAALASLRGGKAAAVVAGLRLLGPSEAAMDAQPDEAAVAGASATPVCSPLLGAARPFGVTPPPVSGLPPRGSATSVASSVFRAGTQHSTQSRTPMRARRPPLASMGSNPATPAHAAVKRSRSASGVVAEWQRPQPNRTGGASTASQAGRSK